MSSSNVIVLVAGVAQSLPNDVVDLVVYTTAATVITHSSDNVTFVALAGWVDPGAGNKATDITTSVMTYISSDVNCRLHFRNA